MPDFTLEYVYANANVTWSSGGSPNNSLPGGSTFTLNGAGGSMIVTDDDGTLQDSVNAGSQTRDMSQQFLAQDFDADAEAGEYVYARGYYDVEDSNGNVGRIYQLRVTPWDYTSPVPGGPQYWAFSGNLAVAPGVTYTVLGTPDSNGLIYLNATGDSDYGGYTQPRCFVAGTLIDTADGPVPVETLRPGDMVRTRDNGFKPVRWIDMQHLDADLLAIMPHLRPIGIAAGALGAGLPRRDLHLSPQHRVTVRNPIVARMFDTDEVLVPAKDLQEVDGIEAVPQGEGVAYFHFLLDDHEIVFAEGAETETLYTGPEALKSLTPEARREVLALFPQLAVRDRDALPARAGRFAAGRRARRMAQRAAQNGVALQAG